MLIEQCKVHIKIFVDETWIFFTLLLGGTSDTEKNIYKKGKQRTSSWFSFSESF